MSDVKTAGAYTTAADDAGSFIVRTPVWVTIIRGFQVFFAFIILILSGLLIHGLAMSAVVFALVCGLFTFITVGYTLIAEKAATCQSGYNIWAVLALDLLMGIFWLSSMAANAALRASFVYDVNADCYDDGSAINAGHCTLYRRGLEKRAVATKTGLAEMSSIAGLSALEMILFIATLVYIGHAFRMHHKGKMSRAEATVEMGSQQNSTYPQYSDQHQYHSQAHAGQLHLQQQQQQQQQQQAPYDPTYYDKHQYDQQTASYDTPGAPIQYQAAPYPPAAQ